MIDYYEPNIELTLLGCGFLGTYHLGAIYLLQQIWPYKPFQRICGASSGGLLAALFASGLTFEEVLDSAIEILCRLNCWRKREALIKCLEEILPDDAHRLCTGRVGISVTKLFPLENKFISQFDTRAELIECIVAGCHIPGWSGFGSFPRYKGYSCVDGAYSDNKPKFKLNLGQKRKIRQIELSPFASKIEVSPAKDDGLLLMRILGTHYHLTLDNGFRTTHAITCSRVSSYAQYFLEGHKNMKEYVFKSDMIICRECYQQTVGNNQQTETNCIQCLKLFEEVDSLGIPEVMLKKLAR